MTKPKPKKRNLQDATLINVNALKKRVAKLEKGFKWVEEVLSTYSGIITVLEIDVRRLKNDTRRN